MPKPIVSILVPVHNMENALYFLERNLYSIAAQDFKDYEIVISDDSPDDVIRDWLKHINLPIRYYKNIGPKGMAHNTNNAMNKALGTLTKILYLDDYFYHNGSLSEIVKAFTPTTWWLATGCTHTIDGVNTFNDHKPYYSESENTIGSPSVVTFKTEIKERFDPSFDWVLDLSFYKDIFRKYGKPKIYDQVNVVIGIGLHQMTNLLSDEQKAKEHKLLKLKYEQATIT